MGASDFATKLTTTAARVPGHKKVVAHIWAGDVLVAELSQESETLAIELYDAGRAGRISLEVFRDELAYAAALLQGTLA